MDELLHTINDRNPSLTYTVKVDGVAQNISAATLVTFKARELETNTTLKINATATNLDDGTEPLRGKVRYDFVAGDVDTAGLYVGWFEVTISGKKQSTPRFVVQIADPSLAPAGSLCTVEQVRMFKQTPQIDVDKDPEILVEILRASALIQNWTGREFAPTAAATRRFMVDPGRRRRGATVVDLMPYDLRTASAVSLHPEGTPVALAANSDYVLSPVGAPLGTYTEVLLSGNLSVTGGLVTDFGHANLDITGDWGHAAVPEAVQYAAILTVASWFRRDIQALGMDIEEPRGYQPAFPSSFGLPPAARLALGAYRRPAIG